MARRASTSPVALTPRSSRPSSAPRSTPSLSVLCTQAPASSSSGWARTPSMAARPTPPVAHWITRKLTGVVLCSLDRNRRNDATSAAQPIRSWCGSLERLPIRIQVDTGVAGGDACERLLGPVGVTGPGEPEEVALAHAALRDEPGPALGGLLRPCHLAAPGRSPDLKVGEDREARSAGACHLRAAVQDVGP